MQELRFGTAERVINPEVPASLAGYFNPRMWTGVRDDICVRALVVEQGETRFGLLQFDLITVNSDVASAIWEAYEENEALHRGNTLLTATHTHTAPETRAGRPGFNPAYIRMAAARAAEALREAAASLRPAAQFDCAWAEDRRFAFNRRYWMRDGRVVTNPPPRDPGVLMAEGPVDFGIPVVRLADREGRTCVLANITNHTDTLGGHEVSADWPGFVQARLRAALGEPTCVFSLIGASGNINHFDPFLSERNSGYAETERIGTGYGDTILSALERAQPLGEAELRVAVERVEAPPRGIPAEAIAEARATLEELADVPEPAEGVTLTSEDLATGAPVARKFFAARLVDAAQDRKTRVFDLTGARYGRWALVSLPCEPFVEIGSTIRSEILPGSLSMVVSHGNGTGAPGVGGGYIANRWNYARGGYETTPRSSAVSEGTAERLIEGARALAARLGGPAS